MVTGNATWSKCDRINIKISTQFGYMGIQKAETLC